MFTKVFEPKKLSIVKRTVSISTSSKAIITKISTSRVTSETAMSTETIVRESNAVQAFFHIVKMYQVQLKALVAFYQIVGNIGFNYSLTWPALFEAIVNEFAVFNLDVMSVLGLNCVTKRFDYIDTSELTPNTHTRSGAVLLSDWKKRVKPILSTVNAIVNMGFGCLKKKRALRAAGDSSASTIPQSEHSSWV